MADLGEDFYASSVEKSEFDGELIPNGTRALAYITSTEVKPGANGKGLNCRWDIIEGPFDKRVVFDFINYQHSKAQVQTIGQQRLKAICEATGTPEPMRDTSLIEFKPCLITIGIQAASKDKTTGVQYDARNTIKKIDALDGARTSTTAASDLHRPASNSTSGAGRKATDAQADKREAGGWGRRNAAQPGGGRMNDVIDDDIPF